MLTPRASHPPTPTGLAAESAYLSMLRAVIKRRRLPYLCLACGARCTHDKSHLSQAGTRYCDGPICWDSDEPEQTLSRHS